ncbi:MAG TPA: hypothetical protein VFZ66_26195 [Herpetosiphonaceae bacterium]
MQQIAGFPFFEIQFDRQGTIVNPDAARQVVDFVGQPGVTDLLVLVHGWNNDISDARRFFQTMLAQLRQQIGTATLPGLAGRSFAILGVIWPSKKFADKELIPGGAASATGEIDDALIERQLENLRGAFGTAEADVILEQASALVPRLDRSPKARGEFANLLRRLLPDSPAQEGEVPEQFFKLSGQTMMERLGKPGRLTRRARPGAALGSTGSAAGLTDFGQMFTGVKAAALNLLNFVTYYQMKDRAGEIGRDGLYPLLRKLRERRPDLKLHLAGHSFGARLITAAIDGPKDQPALSVHSLTLLQAAFSHNGFAQRFDGTHDGLFRNVVAQQRVKGPVLISHTPNDTSVGIGYAIASRLMGQSAAQIGDKNDPFGGLGRNGAQKTPEAIDGTLLDVGGAYAFQPGKVYNLSADQWIKSHSDISSKQVAYALLAGIAST